MRASCDLAGNAPSTFTIPSTATSSRSKNSSVGVVSCGLASHKTELSDSQKSIGIAFALVMRASYNFWQCPEYVQSSQWPPVP
eukprot:7485357-Karenia_brevis.AAC.1